MTKLALTPRSFGAALRSFGDTAGARLSDLIWLLVFVFTVRRHALVVAVVFGWVFGDVFSLFFGSSTFGSDLENVF